MDQLHNRQLDEAPHFQEQASPQLGTNGSTCIAPSLLLLTTTPVPVRQEVSLAQTQQKVHGTITKPSSSRPKKKSKGAIPRPPNAWILYRSAKIKERSKEEWIAEQCKVAAATTPFSYYSGAMPVNAMASSSSSLSSSVLASSTIVDFSQPPVCGMETPLSAVSRQTFMSKRIADMWKAESEENRRYYFALAEKKKEEHCKAFPTYKYVPRLNKSQQHACPEGTHIKTATRTEQQTSPPEKPSSLLNELALMKDAVGSGEATIVVPGEGRGKGKGRAQKLYVDIAAAENASTFVCARSSGVSPSSTLPSAALEEDSTASTSAFAAHNDCATQNCLVADVLDFSDMRLDTVIQEEETQHSTRYLNGPQNSPPEWVCPVNKYQVATEQEQEHKLWPTWMSWTSNEASDSRGRENEQSDEQACLDMAAILLASTPDASTPMGSQTQASPSRPARRKSTPGASGKRKPAKSWQKRLRGAPSLDLTAHKKRLPVARITYRSQSTTTEGSSNELKPMTESVKQERSNMPHLLLRSYDRDGNDSETEAALLCADSLLESLASGAAWSPDRCWYPSLNQELHTQSAPAQSDSFAANTYDWTLYSQSPREDCATTEVTSSAQSGSEETYASLLWKELESLTNGPLLPHLLSPSALPEAFALNNTDSTAGERLWDQPHPACFRSETVPTGSITISDGIENGKNTLAWTLNEVEWNELLSKTTVQPPIIIEQPEALTLQSVTRSSDPLGVRNQQKGVLLDVLPSTLHPCVETGQACTNDHNGSVELKHSAASTQILLPSQADSLPTQDAPPRMELHGSFTEQELLEKLDRLRRGSIV